MKFLDDMKRKNTEEERIESPSEKINKLLKPGVLFSYYDKLFFTLGSDSDYSVFYCEKGTTTLNIKEFNYYELLDLLEEEKLMIVEDEDYLIVDEDLLDEKEREDYIALKKAMIEVVNKCAPDFLYLQRRGNKDDLKELAKECDIAYNLFRRKITRYLTSGMKDYALLSKRSEVFGDRRKRGSTYVYTKKPGRKARNKNNEPINQGVIMDDQMREEILAFADDVRKGRTMRQAFTKYNSVVHLNSDGGGSDLLVPSDQRPTLRQFSYLIDKELSQKDKLMGKVGSFAYHNNHRLLKGDILTGTSSPGDVVEIDAWEADISLIRRGSSSEVIGRPTLYLMIDRYTRMIVAYSLGFEVNSFVGLSSLFMNLAEDKGDMMKRLNLKIERDKIALPEPFIPNVVVTDNGSDFTSKAFRDLLSGLNIDHQKAPPATGSAKGLVERTFGELALAHKDVFKGHGLITKEHGSTHHQDATLSLDEYERYVMLAILKHNQANMKSYPIHDEEILEKNIPCSPSNLWNFYTIDKMLRPRPITDESSYYFNLMKRIKVRLSKDGLTYKGLNYDLGSSGLLDRLQEGEKSKSLDFRLDPRDVSRIYFLDNGRFSFCELNPNKAQNKLFFGKSEREVEDIRAQIRDKKRNEEIENQKLDVAAKLLSESIVESASIEKKRNSFDKNDTDNMRARRKEERFERIGENKIADYIDLDDDDDIIDYNEEPEYNNVTPKFSSEEEGRKFFENVIRQIEEGF